jgi:hypothetical protein
MTYQKTPSLIGAAVGFVTFLTIALLPSLVYGGYAGLLLAGGIFGTPVPASLVARGLVGFGMILGVIATSSVFIVAGAVSGALVGHLTEGNKCCQKSDAN